MTTPVPVEWQATIPADTLARIIAGVRSHIGTSITEAQRDALREADGSDLDIEEM